MSMSGCFSGFSIPASGFPHGYVVFRWDGTTWSVADSSTCTGEIPPTPADPGAFPNDCRIVQCQSFRLPGASKYPGSEVSKAP